jgi:hypothetical protein
MESKIAKSWVAGCARQLAIAIGVFVGGVILLIIFLTILQLAPLPQDLRNDPSRIVGIGFSVLVVIALVLVMVFGIRSIMSRRRQVDVAFTPLGLTGQAYLSNGRQYHGTYQGRTVDAFLYRGPILDLYIGASTRTRLGISTRSAFGSMLSQATGQQTILVADPAFKDLVVLAKDERWAHTLLSEAPARELIARLTADPGPLELRQVIVQPGALLYRLYHTRLAKVTPENVHTWVDELTQLANIAENLPLPTLVEEATPVEQALRSGASSGPGTRLTLVFLLGGLILATGLLFVFLNILR